MYVCISVAVVKQFYSVVEIYPFITLVSPLVVEQRSEGLDHPTWSLLSVHNRFLQELSLGHQLQVPGPDRKQSCLDCGVIEKHSGTNFTHFFLSALAMSSWWDLRLKRQQRTEQISVQNDECDICEFSSSSRARKKSCPEVPPGQVDFLAGQVTLKEYLSNGQGPRQVTL